MSLVRRREGIMVTFRSMLTSSIEQFTTYYYQQFDSNRNSLAGLYVRTPSPQPHQLLLPTNRCCSWLIVR